MRRSTIVLHSVPLSRGSKLLLLLLALAAFCYSYKFYSMPFCCSVFVCNLLWGQSKFVADFYVSCSKWPRKHSASHQLAEKTG